MVWLRSTISLQLKRQMLTNFYLLWNSSKNNREFLEIKNFSSPTRMWIFSLSRFFLLLLIIKIQEINLLTSIVILTNLKFLQRRDLEVPKVITSNKGQTNIITQIEGKSHLVMAFHNRAQFITKTSKVWLINHSKINSILNRKDQLKVFHIKLRLCYKQLNS